MEFTEYYKSIVGKRKRLDLRDKVTSLLEINTTTFYSWMHRGKVPKRHHGIISEITGKTESELFPQVQTK